MPLCIQMRETGLGFFMRCLRVRFSGILSEPVNKYELVIKLIYNC